MYEQKALHVDLFSGFYRVERIRDAGMIGPVDFGFREWRRSRALCFGGGPFMGSILPGSNRLIFTGHSPCWDGFYVSTMGGAGATFENLGINYVALSRRCPSPSVLILRREGQEEVEVEIAPLDLDAVWGRCAAGEETGFHALQRHVWDRWARTFSTPPRVLAVGPAAIASDFGAIGSSRVQQDGPTGAECWAGRGGLGSRLAREHNLYAAIFGGSFVDRDLDDRKLADSYFERRYAMRMLIKDKETTRKYRYDPDLQTGGTLGVNLAKLKDKLFFFNYRSVEWPKDRRLAAYRALIDGHYLRQFNEETIAQKQWSHCGEPCPAVCKKMRGPYKKDYEPYHVMGPQCGVFDQRAAERLVGLCDAAGFDAIQLGGVLSWLLDLADEGLAGPASLGADARPVFSPDGFRAVEDSAANAELACALVRNILERRGDLDMSGGAREAARRIGERSGRPAEVLDRLVVNCSSDRGWMVPNQYWVPGMFSPMAVMGKYYQHYGDEFVPPRELGRINAGRMAGELLLDNMGFCRFHREWAEEMLPEIFRDFWHADVDMQAHHRDLARRINARNPSAFWESRRVAALVHAFLRRKTEEGVKRPELAEWLGRFDADQWEAGRDFWYEVRKGVDEALAG
ncbi:MAG: aldehyde ferredoxin oxidoreductase N-terminal domain-containing protein [Myxococcota bacterium]|nr:aldehyde ferredoxin oxidoreductase N-terminal domain-containing protein [Myxococcota bacterium]